MTMPAVPAGSRVLVTGAGGFIGSRVVESLATAGHRVITLERFLGDIDIVSDLSDPHLLAAEMRARRIEVMVHAAWAGHPRSAGIDYGSQVRDSLTPTLNALLSAGIAGVKQVVFLSTGGGSVTLNSDREPPAYGWAKRMAEALALANAETFDYVLTVLRPSAVYGPGQDPGKGLGAVTVFTASALAGRMIRIFGSPETSRDFLHVDDLADAVRAVIEARVGGAFAVGGPEQVSLRDLVEALETTLGRPVPVTVQESTGVDPATVHLDNSALTAAVGWTPTRHVRDSLPAMVEAMRRGAAR